MKQFIYQWCLLSFCNGLWLKRTNNSENMFGSQIHYYRVHKTITLIVNVYYGFNCVFEGRREEKKKEKSNIFAFLNNIISKYLF